MNILGCMMFAFAGILVIKLRGKLETQEKKDYAGCETAIGKVSHTHDFYGDRWLVYFTDATGREVMGLDDVIADSSFSHKYRRPVFGSEEQIYYYPSPERGVYRINGRVVEYSIHFCNDDLYELHRHVVKRNHVIGGLFGIGLLICAFLILLFG